VLSSRSRAAHVSCLASIALASLLSLALAGPAHAKGSDLLITSGDDALGPAAGDQEAPYIERGGDLFLAVWVDRRTTVPSDDPAYAGEDDVYAARLDADGNLLDTTPIIVAQGVADQSGARACWNGENWLVTWTSRTPAPEHPYLPRGLEAVRISPEGEILDDPPILVYPSPSGSVKYVATGSDGIDWVVFLVETIQVGIDTETYLKGARISPEGGHLGPPVTMFHPECCYFFSLGTGVAYADGQYLLVFECIPSVYVNDAICGMRFTQSLQKIDNYPFEIAGTSGVFRDPQVATDGTDFFTSWYHYQTPPWPPVLVDPFCARVTHGGVSLDPDGIELSGGTGSGDARLPRVAWDGLNWIAAWPDDQGARVARVTPGGVVLDPGGVSFPTLGVNDITADPAAAIRLVWSDDRADGPQPLDVYTTRISSSLIADPEEAISLGAPSHVHADAAPGDGDAMLAFRSDVSGERRVMAQLASGYAAPSRGEPVVLATGPTLSGPEVAWNGSLYLAVWSDEDLETIYGRRFLEDGTVLDDPPITIMAGLEPDVAAVEDDFLVVGTHAVGAPTTREAFAARVRGTDGVVLDGTPILLGSSYAVAPRVAGMYSRWIVTWARYFGFDDERADVWAAFVDADGSTPGQFGVATNQATSETHYAPAVASSPAIAMVVWEDQRSYPGEDWNLYGRRVLVDGTVFDDPDGFAVVAGPLDQRNAAIDWNGTNFQVAYEVTEQLGWFDRSLPDVYGTRVDEYGQVLEPMTFAIYEGETADVLPAVAGGGGEALVVASSFHDGAPYASYRLVARTLSDGTTGVAEGADDPVVESAFRLIGAFPNPTPGEATIRFAVPEHARVSISVYDVRGRLVRRLTDAEVTPGEHDVSWDGRDGSGAPVAAGLYLYRMEAGGHLSTGKLALLR
jgi:hypothetical protein